MSIHRDQSKLWSSNGVMNVLSKNTDPGQYQVQVELLVEGAVSSGPDPIYRFPIS